ncbi:hypothetical protein PQI07_35965 [Methylobacterium sp. 092160098-2]|jgi:hypothetical protein|uniref:hypothetical protein n=1 Tax=Methylobacterium sp. 092160098-2 TaxID=3025129 RepID=UPI002381CBF0|nr:hypothetical protein [Methylobacterium sp. 092160098-2]MDE4915972.1 hypothetical protein [Methylobacterium sp. 092160098-2]
MKSSAIALAIATVIAVATPYVAFAGPNGIDAIKLYELNRPHSVASQPNVNPDVRATGSINSNPHRENTNRRGRGRQ